jgi:hypothetical protein
MPRPVGKYWRAVEDIAFAVGDPPAQTSRAAIAPIEINHPDAVLTPALPARASAYLRT